MSQITTQQRVLRVSGARPETARLDRAAATTADLATLVRAAGEGDGCAWEEIVRRHEPLLRRVAAGFRLSRCDADDVVQRTWLKLFENIHAIKDPACLPGWLATTARRMCLDLFQRQLRESPMEEVDVRETEPSPEELVIAAERRRVVRDAVATLPEHQRMLVTLMTQNRERPYAEIASELRMPVGSIGPTYGRSVRRLREAPALVALCV